MALERSRFFSDNLTALGGEIFFCLETIRQPYLGGTRWVVIANI